MKNQRRKKEEKNRRDRRRIYTTRILLIQAAQNVSERSINGSSCPMDFQVPGELSTSKHRCAMFPRFSYFIRDLLSQIFPYEHGRLLALSQSAFGIPPLETMLFCFAQMNLSTSTLVKTATVHGISMIILIDNHRVSYLLKMLVSFRIVPILILESLFARNNQILKQLPR